MAFSTSASAVDYWQERNIAEQIMSNVPSEEVLWLDSGTRKTFALYKKTNRKKIEGGVILMHDIHTHPDWPFIINPLRVNLAEHGWSTLSLLMPQPTSLGDWEMFIPLRDETIPRVLAAMNFFEERGIQNLVFIGHGVSAALAADLMASKAIDITNINALVIINMPSINDSKSWLNSINSLKNIPISILDVVAEHDIPEVIQNNEARREAARQAGRLQESPTTLTQSSRVQAIARKMSGNLRYRQTTIATSDHFFSHETPALIKTIRGWLKNYALGVEIQVK